MQRGDCVALRPRSKYCRIPRTRSPDENAASTTSPRRDKGAVVALAPMSPASTPEPESLRTTSGAYDDRVGTWLPMDKPERDYLWRRITDALKGRPTD